MRFAMLRLVLLLNSHLSIAFLVVPKIVSSLLALRWGYRTLFPPIIRYLHTQGRNQYKPITLPINTAIGWLFLSQVFELVALYAGFSCVAVTSQVLDELAPYNGLIFLPSNSHVFVELAPLQGLNFFPSNSHELVEVAPDRGFSFLPSHSQSLGNSTLLDICRLLIKMIMLVSQFSYLCRCSISILWDCCILLLFQ